MVMRNIVIVASVLVYLALVGCATTRTRTITSADNLESNAEEFAIGAQYEPQATELPTGHFWRARVFADQAHEFRQTVEGPVGDREVILAFEQLWRSYQALRYEVDRSHNRQAEVALESVTQAFRRVQRDVSGYSDADTAVYARGGFQHDPYYN